MPALILIPLLFDGLPVVLQSTARMNMLFF